MCLNLLAGTSRLQVLIRCRLIQGQHCAIPMIVEFLGPPRSKNCSNILVPNQKVRVSVSWVSVSSTALNTLYSHRNNKSNRCLIITILWNYHQACILINERIVSISSIGRSDFYVASGLRGHRTQDSLGLRKLTRRFYIVYNGRRARWALYYVQALMGVRNLLWRRVEVYGLLYM